MKEGPKLVVGLFFLISGAAGLVAWYSGWELIFAALLAIVVLVALMTILVHFAGGTTPTAREILDEPPQEEAGHPASTAPAPHKDPGEGCGRQVIILIVVVAAIVFIGIQMTAQYAPLPNTSAPPTECDEALMHLGFKPGEVECPKGDVAHVRQGWYLIIQMKVQAIATDPKNSQIPRNWPLYIMSQMMDKTCPGQAVKAQGTQCKLDIGALVNALGEYEVARRIHNETRYNPPSDFFSMDGVILSGLVGAVSMLLVGITFTGIKKQYPALKWIGKIGFDTIFVTFLYFWIVINPLQQLDPRLVDPVNQLIWVGFAAAILPLISIATTAIGMGMGDLVGIGKSMGAFYGFAFSIIAAVVAFFTTVFGLFPNWFVPIEILRSLAAYPGLNAELAINSIIFGSLLFSAIIATPLGPLWTAVSIAAPFLRAIGLAEKVGLIEREPGSTDFKTH